MIRLMRSRKGDWIQIFMILFFVLLLCIALALFFTEKDQLKTERPELYVDLAHQKMQVALISILRMPVEYDLMQDGTPEEISFATWVLAHPRVTEEELAAQLALLLPDTIPYEFTLTWEAGRSVQVDRLNRNWLERIFSSYASGGNVIKKQSPKGTVVLHTPEGELVVELIWGDKSALYQVLRQRFDEQRTSKYLEAPG